MEDRIPSVVIGTKKLSRLWITYVFMTSLFCAGVSSLAIPVTIREEKPTGTEIYDLMTDASFLAILDKSMAVSSLDTPRETPRLHFSILTSSNPWSQYFAVGVNNGVVVTTQKVDRETVCSFQAHCQLSFEVAARSVYGSFFKLITIDVTVLDTNDNPPDFGQPEFELFIPENAESGRSFQLPTAFDRDTGEGNGVERYQLLSDETLFDLETIETALNTSDVFLSLKSTVNRETAASYTVLVGAVDGGQPALTGTLTVKVIVSDINDNFPVFGKSLYYKEVPEDNGLDHPILKIEASDADEGPNGELVFSFSPLQPPANVAFYRIDGQTGEIYLTQSLETQTGREMELVVEARDKGHPPKVSRCKVKIFVKDTINSMPEIIVDTLGGSREMAMVSEYAKPGKVVLHVSVRDPDSGKNGQTSCRVDSAEFGLSPLGIEDKYMIILTEYLDRETTEIYNMTLSCEDEGFPSLLATKEFSVKVLDENDNPPEFSMRNYETSLYENNTIGKSIIQLTVTDKDIRKNAEIDFTIAGINDQYFNIDKDGVMTAKTSLDREYSGRRIVTVWATDRGEPPKSSSTTVVVDLHDVNDMPPVFSKSVYRFEVDEEQNVGRYVGIVSASDEDLGKNKEISYRMAHNSDTSFAVGIDGVIKTNRVLDRETQDFYEIWVLAMDHGVPTLTGTAKIIIRIRDVNDNLPYFLFPSVDNDTVTIPHSLKADSYIVEILAGDNDTGHNGQLMFSLSSINATSPFAINPSTGFLYMGRDMTADEIGLYTLTLVASDNGQKQQWATQTPFFVDVYFDNSTLLASMASAGPSKTVITILIAVGAVLMLTITMVTAFICIKRCEMKKKETNRFPVSASTSSTTKLQGGYYIAPGVQGSSSSVFGKQEDYSVDNQVVDSPDGVRPPNPYVVMVPRPEVGPSEIVEIAHGSRMRLNNTFNSTDLDQTDDGQFSTFKSQDNIFAERRHNSLRRSSVDTCEKRGGNDTFDNDETSCDSTSDSGRGGSDVDVNGAAASKARAAAATPVSVKSGISDRLSPLPRDKHKGTFRTFRGESPSSFKFDSDSDTTLTRPSKSSFKPMPMISSPGGMRITGLRTPRQSESDTDSDFATPGSRLNHSTPITAGIYSPYTGGLAQGGDRMTFRQPYRVAPLPMFMPPSSYHRSESEAEHSDAGSNQSNSSANRRNLVPRLPLYSGIEFSHHAYGGGNRNSIGAFSSISSASNARDGYPLDTDRTSLPQGANYSNPRPYSISNDSSQSTPTNTLYNPAHSYRDQAADPRASNNYGNVISELETSRPVSLMSTGDDFVLPPYPQAEAQEERENLLMHSGYTGYNTPARNTEQEALVPRSRFESSA